MANYPELKGKVACVTGAGRHNGIGAAIATRLAEEGCKIVLSDIGAADDGVFSEDTIGTESELQAIVAGIVDSGGDAITCICDVLSEDDVEAMCRTAISSYGKIDIWINNAGIGYLMEPIVEMEASNWDAVLSVNLRGAFLGTKHAARAMIQQGSGGRIVNIASQASKSGFPFASAYTASKHGLVGLTRVSAIELGPHKITANAVCPNHITTGLGAWQNEFFSKATDRSVDQYMADMRARIPMGRPGLTKDIANACAWLCSDQAEYVNGEAMNVSGGEEMH